MRKKAEEWKWKKSSNKARSFIFFLSLSLVLLRRNSLQTQEGEEALDLRHCQWFSPRVLKILVRIASITQSPIHTLSHLDDTALTVKTWPALFVLPLSYT